MTDNRRYAVTPEGVKKTAEIVGDEITAAQVVSSLFAAATGFGDDRQAARYLRKIGGPVGSAASVAAARAGYEADRRSGMPADEAAIKNVGGLVLGQGIGKMAGFSAGVLALGRPFGKPLKKPWNPSAARGAAVLFDYMGQKDGEYLAEDAQRGWRDAKAAARGAARRTAQEITWVNAPETWVGRKRLGDPY